MGFKPTALLALVLVFFVILFTFLLPYRRNSLFYIIKTIGYDEDGAIEIIIGVSLTQALT